MGICTSRQPKKRTSMPKAIVYDVKSNLNAFLAKISTSANDAIELTGRGKLSVLVLGRKG